MKLVYGHAVLVVKKSKTKHIIIKEMGLSKRMFEEHLNESITFDIESEEWIIGGKDRYLQGKYGQQLRKYDPIAFEIAYNCRVRDTEAGIPLSSAR